MKTISFFILFTVFQTQILAQTPVFFPYDTTGWGIKSERLAPYRDYSISWIEDEWESPPESKSSGVKLVPYITYRHTFPQMRVVIDSFKVVKHPDYYLFSILKKQDLKDTIIVAPEYTAQIIAPNSGYYFLKYNALKTRCMRSLASKQTIAFSLVERGVKEHHLLKKAGYKLFNKDTIFLKNEELPYYFKPIKQDDTAFFYHQEIDKIGKLEWVNDGEMREIPSNGVLVRKGGIKGFNEIACCLMTLEAYLVKQVPIEPIHIQEALKRKGYYTGEIDGKTNKKLKSAIAKFHKDNGIPISVDSNLRAFFKILDPNTYYSFGYE